MESRGFCSYTVALLAGISCLFAECIALFAATGSLFVE